MRTVAISRCSQELQRILKTAKKADVVLRSPGGTEVLLSLIDDFDYELAAQRRNQKLMAFLDERFRQARKEKGIPLEEVKRRLGLPGRSGNNMRAVEDRKRPLVRMIVVSRRSQVILDLLEQARSEDLIVKIAAGSECCLSVIHDGDHKAANSRRSEVVMAYLDERAEQGKLPPLEVVFVQELPRPKTPLKNRPMLRGSNKKSGCPEENKRRGNGERRTKNGE